MKKEENSSFRRFGLIGKNITHSFSPDYFNQKFKQEKIPASYKLFDLSDIQQFPNIFMTNNLVGLNVTTPYKEEIIFFMDELSAEAEEIGAINTIRIKGQHIKGFNTDWAGFKQSIEPWLNDQHTKALILGTGGATKAVKYALQQLGISFDTVSRTPGKADYIYSDLNEFIISDHKIIINATPVGTFPNVDNAPEIPYEHLGPNHLVYDLIYNPDKTKFLQVAEMHGAVIKNGREMLEIQAEEAWKIWNS